MFVNTDSVEKQGENAMDKSLLWVTRRFFPRGDASSQVIGNLLEPMFQLGYQSDVLVITEDQNDQKHNRWQRANVIHYYVASCADRAQRNRILCQTPLKGVKIIVQKCIWKVLDRISPYHRSLNINTLLLSQYKKALRVQIKQNHYDAIIVTLWPIEAVLAVLEIAPMTPCYLYQLDTYWDNLCFDKSGWEKRWEFEKKILFKMDKVFTTPLIYRNHVLKEPLLSTKIEPLMFPLIKPYLQQAPCKKTHSEKLHCVFLGTLYPQLRPPQEVIRIISQLENSDFVFDFYGSNQHLIKQSPNYHASKHIICCYGQVSSETALQRMGSADVLIHIDNHTSTQLSSKIFDYMRTGKPILNFYACKDSETLHILSHYPLCCNIFIGNIVDEIKIKDFLQHSKDQRVPFHLVEKNFIDSTPAYVAQKIVAFLPGGNL